MMSRSVLTFLAATVISAPVALAPALVTPAAAQVEFNLSFGATPPPAPMYEVVPAPRPGYVWAPGAWHWENGRHVWSRGHWEVMRTGYRFVPDRWEKTYVSGREQWQFHPSRWERGPNGDRDHDGIPNKYDRHDDRGPWGDRDHDGIPNKYDRHDNRR